MLEKIVKYRELNNCFISDDELKFFTKTKTLFDYQVDALKKTLKFFEIAFENKTLNKEKIYQNYLEFDENISKLTIKDSLIAEEKFSYLYLGKEHKEISFKDLVNRCSYWMATGSGKTVVMIKLVDILKKLIKTKKIPNKKILILAPSNSIIEQIKNHFEEFNKENSNKLYLKDLREFNEYDDLYIYRGDNIVASETKTEQLNFYDFLNNGDWYLILDEAHKGDKDESIRQKLFSLIAKNGIMFNFSATFTEEIDKISTIKDFKLDKFLTSGYGKKISLLDSSVATGDDEQKNSIVKSLILLSAMKKEYNNLKPLYSPPLMLVLANSVNIEKADLKEYFKNLQAIISGDFDFNKLKNELVNELKRKRYLFGLGEIKIDTIQNLNENDFYRVFNITKASKDKIEVSRLIGNNDELVFKLKGSNEYFMLINASNINKWTNEFLDGYEIVESIEESLFKNLDNKESISILMGSRKFIEGWDSNRPSIINFVNLGTTKEAKKLILQAIGRGVRIEPFKNFRKRLCNVEHNENDIKTINKNSVSLTICKSVNLIESLFIFPSKKEQIEKILLSLEEVSDNLDKECKKITIKKQTIKDLCYPVFKESKEFNEEPFVISKGDFDKLQKILSIYDEVTLLLKFDISPRTIQKIQNKSNFTIKNKQNLNLEDYELLKVIDNYFNKKIKKFIGFEIVNDDIIKHYKHICAEMDEESIKEFQKDLDKIIKAKKCPDKSEELKELKNVLKNRSLPEIAKKEIEKQIIKLQKDTIQTNSIPSIIDCKLLLEHYYIPLLHLKYDKEKREVIETPVNFKHIIKVVSEIEFIYELIEVIPKLNEVYDSWYFSKLDESLDEIKIPYFNSDRGDYDNFSPDFIFWLKQKEKRKIVFVDPKGIEHTRNARDKIIGFENFVKNINDSSIEVKLFLYNQNSDKVDSEKKEYWSSNLDEIFELSVGE